MSDRRHIPEDILWILELSGFGTEVNDDGRVVAIDRKQIPLTQHEFYVDLHRGSRDVRVYLHDLIDKAVVEVEELRLDTEEPLVLITGQMSLRQLFLDVVGVIAGIQIETHQEQSVVHVLQILVAVLFLRGIGRSHVGNIGRVDETVQGIYSLFDGILYVLDGAVVQERPLFERRQDVTVVPVSVLVFMAYRTVIDPVLRFSDIEVILAVKVLSVEDVDDEPVPDLQAVGMVLYPFSRIRPYIYRIHLIY